MIISRESLKKYDIHAFLMPFSRNVNFLPFSCYFHDLKVAWDQFKMRNLILEDCILKIVTKIM